MSLSRRKRIQEQVEKGRRKRKIITIVIAVALIATIITTIYFTTRPSGPSRFPFPCLGFEGTRIHVHPWLKIEINNRTVPIPAFVGIVSTATGTCFEPLHTHDSSGIIHVESDNASAVFTLGDFFTIWNDTYGSATFQGQQLPIIFNATEILGFKNDSNHHVKLLVDNNTDTTDWDALKLIPLDYCSGNRAGVPPCSPTAGGDPAFPGGYPFGTGHTIVINY